MTQREHVLNGVKLNLWVTLFVVPIWGMACLPFIYNSGWTPYWHEVYALLDAEFFILLPSGIFVHEMLHALTWMLLNQQGFAWVKFGFNVNALTPYTHFKAPMKVWKYALGGAMPGFIMGFIPVGLSYFFASAILNFVGFLFLWAAGGDIISLMMLRKVNRNDFVLDHPDKMGFLVVDKE